MHLLPDRITALPRRSIAGVFALLLILPTTLPASIPAEGQGCAAALGGEVSGTEEQLDTSLDFLSWNIQKASNEGWREDLRNFASNVHLAFIQEAAVQASITGALPVRMHQAFAAGYSTAERETGVLTLSSGAPSLRCHFTAREPWLGTPKATSITEHPIRGRQERLLAVNMHAVNFALGLQEFREQVHALDVVMDNHRGPVIFAGDLNTWSAGRQALVDAFMHKHGLQPVAFAPDLRTTFFGNALDHVYVRGIRAGSARVAPVSSSDHNALLVHLEIL
ncbi:MAG: endonuclease/exonuclease/phosphatase family protein [Sedimenticolaceae bacterium]